MSDSPEKQTEDAKERSKLLKEISQAKSSEEVQEIRDKLLERLDKKVADLKELIREEE
jgi:hypothetical protein